MMYQGEASGSGDYITVANISTRNAIPLAKRKEMLMVGVASVQKVYLWENGAWVEFGGAPVTEPAVMLSGGGMLLLNNGGKLLLLAS